MSIPGAIFRPFDARPHYAVVRRVTISPVFLVLGMRSRRALAAENLFLRKQLARFQERRVKPRRDHDSARLVMVILSRMFSRRDALMSVRYVPPLGRKAYRLF